MTVSDEHTAALAQDIASVRAVSRRVVVNGVTHHVLDYEGSGPTVLLLPGITSPAITWDFVADPLSRHGRVIVVDVRGRGLSDSPASGYSLSDYAADTVGLIRELGLNRPVLLGHSMGARIAAAAALRELDVVGPLLLVDPPLSGPGRPPYPTSLTAFLTQLDEANHGTTGDAVRRYWPGWEQRELDLRARWLPTCSRQAVVETHHGFENDDFLDYWPRLTAPLVLMHGGSSPVVPDAAAQELGETNPAANVVRIERAGHMIPWDRFDLFMDAVSSALARFARGTDG